MPEIITSKISRDDLKKHLVHFGDMVKFVVDVEKSVLAIGGEMHSDCEELLLEQGSKQENLWGANLYPFREGDERIEYTSLINIRPSLGNRDMKIQDEVIRRKVREVAEVMLFALDERL